MPSRLAGPLALAVVVLALAGCQSPASPAESSQALDQEWLTDNLDLDTYQVSGTIDGLEWSTLICAINLMPNWQIETAAQPYPQAYLQFEAYDTSISGGVVSGGWTAANGNPMSVATFSGNGTWVRQGAANGTDPGSLVLTLAADEATSTGTVRHDITANLALTPIVTPDANQEPCGFPLIDLESLQDTFDSYQGPTGGGN
ncbi:MAG: hypothetical protein ABIR17_00285 [Pseudolysinimonas sp.]|uniref:hypothetical protein n=1 Tax=Pseudolysinimonas sp. TaxID=2680009 RepID=UPI00326736B4